MKEQILEINKQLDFKIENLVCKAWNRNEQWKIIYNDIIKAILDRDKALIQLEVDFIKNCPHEDWTNYCNTDGSYSHKQCNDCLETLD